MIKTEHSFAKTSTASDPRERRGTPRIQVLGQLHGHIVTLDVPVKIREIGLGGFSIETPMKFPIGAVHEFRLTHVDGETVNLCGRVVHSGERERSTDPGLYITGFAFLDDPTGQTTTHIGALIDKITGVLSFDVS